MRDPYLSYPEPRYRCFGGFRHRRITLRSRGPCVPKGISARGVGGYVMEVPRALPVGLHRILGLKFQIPNCKSQINLKFQFQMTKTLFLLFGIWTIGIYLLFGLPARNRFGEGRCL